MPKVSPIQSSFSSGEWDPLLGGRVDLDRYKMGLGTCLNYIPTTKGPLLNRPGTKYVAPVADVSAYTPSPTTSAVRLVGFEYSTTDAYIIELGHVYARFFKNNAQIENPGIPGTPLEFRSPWLDTQINQVKFTQSADVLYCVHRDVAPTKLLRYSDTWWRFIDIDFKDGPYLAANASEKSITPSAATGSGITLTTGPAKTITNVTSLSSQIQITTSADHNYNNGDKVYISGVTGTTEANGTWFVTVLNSTTFTLDESTFTNTYVSGGTVNPALFTSDDVDRLVRMKEGSAWGYVKITAYTDPSSVTADVVNTLTNTNAKTNWRLGAFGGDQGYPSCVVFHEDRLFLAGVPGRSQTFYGSRTGDYENFAPTDPDGTITSSHAVSFTLNSADVNAIRWMESEEKGLLAGSVGGEWVIRSSSSQEAITPTNVSAKRALSYGCEDIQPVQAGKAVIYPQRGGRNVRELIYYYDVDGYRSTNLSELSQHLTVGGILQFASQRTPHSVVWAVRSDGVLLAMSYDRDIETLKVGWARQILGGVSDAAGTHAKVLSTAVIPSADGTRDELWLVVERYINGQTVRTVEYMTKFFDDETEQQDQFFVDCGLTYDDPKTITGVTKANPAVVTCSSHGFSNGDTVILRDVVGMTEVNDIIFTIANVTANTFELRNAADTADIDSTAYTTYISGGEARKRVSTISGLTHLEGEEVTILADGATHASKTVSAGAITLDTPATVVHVGLYHNREGQLLRLDAGSADGTSIGKIRRINRVGFYLHRSLNLMIGTDFDDLDRITFRSNTDDLNEPPELYTGIVTENLHSNYDLENQICWRQDQPHNSTILAVMPRMVTQDG